MFPPRPVTPEARQTEPFKTMWANKAGQKSINLLRQKIETQRSSYRQCIYRQIELQSVTTTVIRQRNHKRLYSHLCRSKGCFLPCDIPTTQLHITLLILALTYPNLNDIHFIDHGSTTLRGQVVDLADWLARLKQSSLGRRFQRRPSQCFRISRDEKYNMILG